MDNNCNECMNFEYNDYYDCYCCSANFDEDEMYRYLNREYKQCPYFRRGDEYTIVRKQI